MGRATVWFALLVIVLFDVCCALPQPCTNLRLIKERESINSGNLLWDPPLIHTSNHYRVRCLRGCERYTSVQWDTKAPWSKVPSDVLLRSSSSSRPQSGARGGGGSIVSFLVGVSYVDSDGLESPSTNISIALRKDHKTKNHIYARDDPSTTGQSLTSGAVTTTGGGNQTTNSTTSGQLTSGSSFSTTSTSTSTSSTSTSTSSTTSQGMPTILTIVLTISGDPNSFNVTEFSIRLARSLNISESLVSVTIVTHKRAESFSVQAQITYPPSATVANNAQISDALNSSDVTSYLIENNFQVTNVDITVGGSTTTGSGTSSSSSTTSSASPGGSTTSPVAEEKHHKSKVHGAIIAAIVVPVVVVLAAIIIVIVVLRMRRRRWERRGVELEQIYKSF